MPVPTKVQYFPSDFSSAVGLAAEFFYDDPTFGGAYLDAGGTGYGVFLFTGDAMSRRSIVAAHLPPGMPFELRSVLRSHVDMLALKARIAADRSALRDNLGLVSIGIDIERNVVLVGLMDPTPANQNAFIDRYGDALAFRRDRPSHID